MYCIKQQKYVLHISLKRQTTWFGSDAASIFINMPFSLPHFFVFRFLRLRRNTHWHQDATFDSLLSRAAFEHLGKGWIVHGTTTRRLPYWANWLFHPSWNRLYRFAACGRLPGTDLTLLYWAISIFKFSRVLSSTLDCKRLVWSLHSACWPAHMTALCQCQFARALNYDIKATLLTAPSIVHFVINSSVRSVLGSRQYCCNKKVAFRPLEPLWILAQCINKIWKCYLAPKV